MSSPGLVARAEVLAEQVGGRTRCTTLRSSPPLTFRATPGALHLVGTAAGPVGGDDLGLELHVAAGASLAVRSVAAAIALPAPVAAPSQLRTTASVGEGAVLRWLPEPTILAARCDHRATTRLRLGLGASLLWREEVVLGRHGEGTGSLLSRLVVDRDGRPLLRNDLAVGPCWPGWDGPAGVGSARAVGSLLAVGAAAGAVVEVTQRDGLAGAPGGGGLHIAAAWLAEDAVLVTAVAASPGLVRRGLDGVLAGAVGVAGTPP